jgi:hypothetical protein
MIRNVIISPHFGQRGFLRRSSNTAYPSIGKCTIGRALRESYVLKVTVVWKSGGRCAPITNEFLEYEICAMFATGPERSRLPKVCIHSSQPGSLLMRSKLVISGLVVASLFGSTLIASAQSQPAPGASSEGNVGPGATSGKKTKHEKGMTTGSSTHSGAKKGGAANPSDQDDAGSGAMAAPKSGSKY